MLIISLFFLCATFLVSSVFTEDEDIGIRFRDGSTNVPIAVCSPTSVCPCTSALMVRKGDRNYHINLVNTGDALATKMRVQTPGGATRAAKRFTPPVASGSFTRESASPKFGKTWVASITCGCVDGTQRTIGTRSDGKSYPIDVTAAVWNAIDTKHLNITKPSDYEPILRSTGACGREPFTWYDNGGTEQTVALTAICRILGYDSYISSTCRDEQRSFPYTQGKCNFHSHPGDHMYRFQ